MDRRVQQRAAPKVIGYYDPRETVHFGSNEIMFAIIVLAVRSGGDVEASHLYICIVVYSLTCSLGVILQAGGVEIMLSASHAILLLCDTLGPVRRH